MMAKEKTEGMQLFKAAADRIRSGNSESEEVELPSGRVRLTPNPNTPNGLQIEVLDAGAAVDFRKPDPKMLEAMERVKDIMGRFRAGELDSAEIPLPSGETMELTRDGRSPGAFSVRSPAGGPNMLTIPFEPSPSRPEHYPGDLPFLPEQSVALTEMEGESFRALTWFIVEDPDESLHQLRVQLVTEGWEEGEESNVSAIFGTVTSMEFGMGGKKRTVMLNRFGEHSQLKLIEHWKKEEES